MDLRETKHLIKRLEELLNEERLKGAKCNQKRVLELEADLSRALAIANELVSKVVRSGSGGEDLGEF